MPPPKNPFTGYFDTTRPIPSQSTSTTLIIAKIGTLITSTNACSDALPPDSVGGGSARISTRSANEIRQTLTFTLNADEAVFPTARQRKL